MRKNSVYQIKKLMRESGNTKNTKTEKFFKILIDETLKHNKIQFHAQKNYKVIIPDYKLTPEIDILYLINNKKIAIEVDGPYHEGERQQLADSYRDKKLGGIDIKVFRLKSWKYELLWSEEPLPKKKVLEYYDRMFEELRSVFSWEKKISSDRILEKIINFLLIS